MSGAVKTESVPLRTALGRVRGLGSAKSDVHHWWVQRVTAVALVPLTLWFVCAVIALAGEPLPVVRAWIASPFNAVLLLCLIGATFHHLQLGLQVVIEDYVHNELAKLLSILAVKFVCYALAAACVFSVLKISFGV